MMKFEVSVGVWQNSACHPSIREFDIGKTSGAVFQPCHNPKHRSTRDRGTALIGVHLTRLPSKQ